MSVRVLSKVLRHSRGELGTRLVAIALADSAHDDGVTWASQEVLAEKARLSDRQVRRAIDNLVELGELEVRKVQRGTRRVNLYRMLYDGLPEPDLERMPAEVAETLRPDNLSAGRPDKSDRDDRTNPSAPTRAQDDRELNRKKNRKAGANAPAAVVDLRAPDLSEPPPAHHVDGRDPPFDAICEVCRIDRAGPRKVRVPSALHGKGERPGVRRLFWEECRRVAERNDAWGELEALHADPERFALLLAQRIREKAGKLRAQQSWRRTIEPQTLEDFWLDVELESATLGGGLTEEDLQRWAENG